MSNSHVLISKQISVIINFHLYLCDTAQNFQGFCWNHFSHFNRRGLQYQFNLLIPTSHELSASELSFVRKAFDVNSTEPMILK